jgi:radical SAM protein with 4Fe4S-binding SPASM domain
LNRIVAPVDCNEACAATPWADEYFVRVRPYVYVRLDDNLLIKRPNMACRLNPSGARILKALLDGVPLAAVLARLASTDIQPREIAAFLLAVRHYLEGRVNEFCINPAVSTTPHPLEFSTLPVLAEFALTYRCNLRCQFCYAGCNHACSRGAHDDALSLSDQKRIITAMVEHARVPSLSFTGGEPLLAPRLEALIRHAKRLDLRVNLISNGTLIDARVARQLARAGVDSAQISIEGVTAATHDALVDATGAFAQAVAAVRHLRAAGIHTHANTTVTRANLAECAQMPRFARETLGCDRFSMNLLIPTGSGARHRELQVHYREVGALIEQVSAASAACGVEFMWYAPVPLCLFNTVAFGLGAKGCGACDGLFSVAPNGDVLPCSACEDPVGNLLRDTFGDIWQSERARRYRAKHYAPAQCRACPELNICHGACLLYWQALGCDELPTAAPAPLAVHNVLPQGA